MVCLRLLVSQLTLRLIHVQINYLQRMFSGVVYDVPANTGKKILGLASRRDQAFSIAWENTPSTLNQFQLRNTRNKEVTAKITTQSIIQGQQDLKPQRPSYELQQKDYERIFYENPNISQEELDKLMDQYDQYQRGTPSRGKDSTAEAERRLPVRPRENMKDIIYNGVGVVEEAGRVGSRRNNSNFKADSYNYYPGRS